MLILNQRCGSNAEEWRRAQGTVVHVTNNLTNNKEGYSPEKERKKHNKQDGNTERNWLAESVLKEINNSMMKDASKVRVLQQSF